MCPSILRDLYFSRHPLGCVRPLKEIFQGIPSGCIRKLVDVNKFRSIPWNAFVETCIVYMNNSSYYDKYEHKLKTVLKK